MADLQIIGGGILTAKDLELMNHQEKIQRLKKLIKTLEASKTEHELPNDYGYEYNRGFVSAINSVLTRLNSIVSA